MSEIEVNADDNPVEIGPSMPSQMEASADGEVKDFERLNGFPMYKEGHILDGRCQIFERIGWDDRVGPTFLALGPENKELVIRVGNEEQLTPKMEAAFLCKAEQEHEWPKFSQVHSIFHYDDCMFLALYFRGGPTLQQCFQFSKTKFGHGSAGRLAEDVLQIIRTVHRLGYMMRSLDLDQFHFDAASRHLFMADISDLRRSTDNNGETIGVSWIGCQLFAPLSHNFGVDQSKKGEIASLHQRDEFEAWFYMFVYLVKDLPWDGLKVENLMWTKVGSLEEKIFENLPQQYRDIFAIINDEPSDKPITDDEFNRITLLVKEIYQKVGGIADHEENFDFERDPTEDELPRFVAERVLNNTKEESVNHE